MGDVRAAVAAAIAAWVVACAPAPQNVPCDVDADCGGAGSEVRYCLESRCVECLSAAMCTSGEHCVDGRCRVK
jgi:hypothetical protein